MKSYEEIVKTFPQQKAEFDTEFEAAARYHERTGRQWEYLSNTQRCLEIEAHLNEIGDNQ